MHRLPSVGTGVSGIRTRPEFCPLPLRWLWCLLPLLQPQQPSWPRMPRSHAHLRVPPTPILPSLSPPLSLCMTSSPGSCLHHLHILGCSEISQVARPEGEGNTGLSSVSQLHAEETTPGAPALGFPSINMGSLFLGATMGCRERVCTAQGETSLWGVGEKAWGSV